MLKSLRLARSCLLLSASDTNSLYLTEQVNLLGVEVVLKTIVGDDLKRLVAAAEHALFRSEIVIFSGGLGPTEDDLPVKR